MRHRGAAPASLTEQQGRLAQSEERYVHIVEVVGSRPASPTRSVRLRTLYPVVRSCEKLGCNEPAEVAFGIDRVACVVWLETYDEDEPRHLNRLCDDHAARLTLPRGWSFDDRRDSSPRLFARPRVTTAAKVPTKITPLRTAKESAVPSGRASEPTREPASKPAAKTPRKSSSKTGSIPRRTARDGSQPLKRTSGPGLFDPTIPMNSPTLDATRERLFAAVPSEAALDEAVVNEAATIEAVTPAYAPKFDRTSDVGGALKAGGRLLSRAFSSQTKPIERPTPQHDTDALPQGDHLDDFNQGDHID